MTAQIQRELEATRTELRRGVVELPQETQETTAQMRRVVADQIKALNELASLVSRSNRVVDAAPAVQPRRAAEMPAPAPFSPAPEAHPVPLASPPAARFVEPTPAPKPHFQAAEPSAPPSPPAIPAAPPRIANGPAEPVAPRREAGARGGWLSDLLNRASRDDEPVGAARPATPTPDRAQANTLDSLDSISVDIARMIDHDAVVELWDRYRGGERNVFTRRLYTLQGQQTFDEIRRKYQRDPEFKETVDRYVTEFERLIADVSRDDRDSTLRKAYLTSETGKVYTMLAHAAGRLE
jgi:hypothetical protein